MANSNLLRAPASKFSGKVIIYCEGRNTEPSYFKLLKPHCIVEPVPQRGVGVGCCMDFVNDVIKKHTNRSDRSKFQQKWIVFDCDGHDDYDQAIKNAINNDFEVAFSNMCIEYWFLLHLIDHNGQPIPLPPSSVHGRHSLAQINMINRAIKQYNSNITKGQRKIPEYNPDSKIIEEGFFDHLMAINPSTGQTRLTDAYIRAKRIHETNLKNGNEYVESVTTMYRLINALGIEITTPEQQFFNQLKQKFNNPRLTHNGDKIFFDGIFVCKITSTRPSYVIEVSNDSRKVFNQLEECLDYVVNLVRK